MQTPDISHDQQSANIIAHCRRQLEELWGFPVKVTAVAFKHLDDVSPQQFVQDCAKLFGLHIRDLHRRDRSRPVIDIRHAIMFALYTYSSHSLSEVGAAMGGLDHTTVLNAVRKMGNYLYVRDKVALANIDKINAFIASHYYAATQAGQHTPLPTPPVFPRQQS